jgi:hypothetical protein
MSTYGVGVKPALPSLHERQVPAAEKDAGSDGGAWQREMERAQMLAWLSHSAIGHTAAVPDTAAVPSATDSTGPLAAAAQSCKTPVRADSASTATVAPALLKAPLASAPGLGADARHTFLAQGSQHRAAVAGEMTASGSRQRPVPPISAAPITGNMDSQTEGQFAGTLVAEKTLADGPDALQPMTRSQQGALPLSAEPQALSAGPRSGPVSSIHRDMAEFMAVLRGFGPHVTMSGDMRAAHAAKSGPLALAPPAGLSTSAAADPASGQPWIREDPLTATPLQAGDRRAQATQLTSRSQNAAVRATAGSPAEPVRVHAEWSKEGVRLYLGIDASALGSLQAVTLQLQAWLSAQGFRLRSISCNGRVITQEPPTADTFQSELPSAELPRFPTARSTPKEFP